MDPYEGEEVAEAADVDDADGTEVSIDANATRSDADESYHSGSEVEELPEGLRARVDVHAGQWAAAAIALTTHLRKLNDHLHHLDVMARAEAPAGNVGPVVISKAAAMIRGHMVTMPFPFRLDGPSQLWRRVKLAPWLR